MSINAWRATTSRLFGRRNLLKTDNNARTLLAAAFFDPLGARGAVVEDADAVAIAASASLGVSLAAVEAADAISIAAAAFLGAAVAVTEAADAVSASASTALQTVQAALAVVEAPEAVSATASTPGSTVGPNARLVVIAGYRSSGLSGLRRTQAIEPGVRRLPVSQSGARRTASSVSGFCSSQALAGYFGAKV